MEDDHALAFLAGANLVTFTEDVPPPVRQDIINVLLTARISADAQMPSLDSLTHVVGWFDRYAAYLSDRGFLLVEEGVPEFEVTDRETRISDLVWAVGNDLLPAMDRTGFVVWSHAFELLAAMPASGASRQHFSDSGRSGGPSGTARVQTTLVSLVDPKQVRLVDVAFAIEPGAMITDVLSTGLDHDGARLDLRWRLFTADVSQLRRAREATRQLLLGGPNSANQYAEPLIETQSREYR